jgi:hypothetical protein
VSVPPQYDELAKSNLKLPENSRLPQNNLKAQRLSNYHDFVVIFVIIRSGLFGVFGQQVILAAGQ